MLVPLEPGVMCKTGRRGAHTGHHTLPARLERRGQLASRDRTDASLRAQRTRTRLARVASAGDATQESPANPSSSDFRDLQVAPRRWTGVHWVADFDAGLSRFYGIIIRMFIEAGGMRRHNDASNLPHPLV